MNNAPTRGDFANHSIERPASVVGSDDEGDSDDNETGIVHQGRKRTVQLKHFLLQEEGLCYQWTRKTDFWRTARVASI